MKPSVKSLCPTCHKKFLPKSEKNLYCSRRCFKKNYYHRKKAEELSNSQYPVFMCPSCAREIILDFDPIKKAEMWLSFVCPWCRVLMINVSEDIKTQETTAV